MEEANDYKRFAILYVDDEEKSLKYFTRAFEPHFQILTASSAVEGLALLEQRSGEIGLLITDQRMPGEKGVWLLQQSRQRFPYVIRILATAYSDMDTAIAAVNSGAIYKYITKPWDPGQMEQTIKRALDYFMIVRERDQLLREKLSILRNMMIADRIVSLGLLAAGLSHHIRNSLVAVKTFLDLAPAKLAEENIQMNRLRNPDFWQDYYQKVQIQIEKINNLLKDLWSASEPGGYEFSDTVQITELVGMSIEALRAGFAGRRIEIDNQMPAGLPPIKANRPKLLRLFDLLLKDELASLPAGSRVTFRAQARPDFGSPTALEIEVTDNGPGLPEEALRIMFDPFVVRSDTPMEYGIHLMACYFIVHHHGGKIEAQNPSGGGTTFLIRLPLNPIEATPTATDTELFKKALLNEDLWRKLISF